MSDSQEEISTTPLPGAISAGPLTLPSTQSPGLAFLWSLPLLVKPFTAWALLGLAWARLLPPLLESIRLAEKSCGSDWKPWIGPLIYTALTGLTINPKVMRDAGGAVGALTSLVAAVKGAKGPSK